MNETATDTDLQLLARYTREGVEAAFTELVSRHLGLVYSAALRQVRSPQLAEEVAQSAFTDLARNAGKLKPDTILTAWLYQVTRRTAIDVVRREARRQMREQIATEMNAMNASSGTGVPPVWSDIEQHLDEAMSALDDTDRAAVLLRYFENKSLREVGATLGTSDDAAQKRVSRAVERLREFFAKRGVTVGTSGLVAVISANAVQAAPVGLAITISTAAALAGTTIATTATAVKTIAMTTLQKTLVTATIVAGMATPLVIQHQNQVKLRGENASLRQQIGQVASLTAENERLSNLVAQPSPTLSKDQLNDLLRLRGEVGMLRRQTNEVAKLREENRSLQGSLAKAGQNLQPASSPEDTAAQHNFPREAWAFTGYATPEATMLALASSAVRGDPEMLLNCMSPDAQSRLKQKWQREGKGDVQIRDELAKEFDRIKAIRILNRENISENEITLYLLMEQNDGRTEMQKMNIQRIGNEWKLGEKNRPAAQKAP